MKLNLNTPVAPKNQVTEKQSPTWVENYLNSWKKTTQEIEKDHNKIQNTFNSEMQKIKESMKK